MEYNNKKNDNTNNKKIKKLSPKKTTIQNGNSKPIYNVKVTGYDTVFQVSRGTPFRDIIEEVQKEHPSLIVAIRINSRLKELYKKVKQDCSVELVDLTSFDGLHIYERGIIFILSVVIREMFSGKNLVVYHSIGMGLYCEIEKYIPTKEDIQNIKQKMVDLINKDLPIMKKTFSKSEALQIFENQGHIDKVKLLHFRKKHLIDIYSLQGSNNYFYGYMVPATSYLQKFDLLKEREGFILVTPIKTGNLPDYEPQMKFAQTFVEYKKWATILNIKYTGELNNLIVRGDREVSELIQLSEGLHEKKISQIANEIQNRAETKLVLIAGPTSSGKTTFCKRLCLHLRINGFQPRALSLDDYFKDKVDSPKDADGNYDLENIGCIQLDLLNQHLEQLIKGEEITLPKYDFKRGITTTSKNKMQLNKDDILVIEGIHALNPYISTAVSSQHKFKIYISAITQLDLDPQNRIHAADTRRLRRIVRDFKYRRISAENTLELWQNVKRGEFRNIFPYQETADAMFNSALPYELAALKIFAEPVLQAVPESHAFISEAERLIRLLDYFLPLTQTHEIPGTSIFREFMGGSYFKY